jgi:hypothetical protein
LSEIVQRHQQKKTLVDVSQCRDRKFCEEERVYYRNFSQIHPEPRWLSGSISKCLGPVTVVIKTCDSGQLIRRHIDHVRKRSESDPMVDDQDCDVDISLPVDIPPASTLITASNHQFPNLPQHQPTRYPSRARRPPDRFRPQKN